MSVLPSQAMTLQIFEKAFGSLDRLSLKIPDGVKRVSIDVGLSINAPQSQVWLTSDPDLYVIGFEPLLNNIKRIYEGNLIWPLNLNPDFIGRRMTIFPCALADGQTPRKQKFFVARNDPGCSSLLTPRRFQVSEEVEVDVLKLDDFFPYFPWNRIDSIYHLKIDTQGSDYQVLKGAEKFLERINAVTVEIDEEDYEGTQNSLSKISYYLKSKGFKRAKKSKIAKFTRRVRGIKVKINTDDETFIRVEFFKNRTTSFPTIFQRG